eukprot:TRINITY_DN3113_c0_g1_i1.p1 TRINITY_DN3113_c0_g1~~TRINITY_DN3113_c0_g1_i1.p1  ORF type:complete len:523 (-),score=58.61 TRINITY_DN3113_c0_g1_i1:435-2003(-)
MQDMQHSGLLPLDMQQAIQLVKSRKTLRNIVKLDSLVVNGLEKEWDKEGVEQELKQIFKSSEGVKDIKIITNNVSQELLGHAYVNYVSQEAARKALVKHKYTAKIRGKQLKMMYSVRPNDLIHEDEIKMCFSVCVKNLDPSIDLQTLDAKFNQYGDILRSHVDDDAHGRDRFALIQYMDMKSAEEAVRKNQKAKFGSTIITVEPYRPKALMESFRSEHLEHPRTPPPGRSHSAMHHYCDPQSPEYLVVDSELRDGIGLENGYQEQSGELYKNPAEISLSNVAQIDNMIDDKGNSKIYSEILLQYRNGDQMVDKVCTSPPPTPSPRFISDLKFMDSARSQPVQQNGVQSLFQQDIFKVVREQCSSPTAVTPPPPSPSPKDEDEVGQYKLFEGTQLFGGEQPLFTEASQKLQQLLPYSSNSSELDALQNLKCPLSREVFRDPVMASDGIIYERAYIEAWMAKNSSSPCTYHQLESNCLQPVIPLRDALTTIQQQQVVVSQQQVIIEDLKKRLEQIRGLSSSIWC